MKTSQICSKKILHFQIKPFSNIALNLVRGARAFGILKHVDKGNSFAGMVKNQRVACSWCGFQALFQYYVTSEQALYMIYPH